MSLASMSPETLLVECVRLLTCLETIRECEDRRCCLCPYCLAAVQLQPTWAAPPKIKKDDPIREYKTTEKERRAVRDNAFKAQSKMLENKQKAQQRMDRWKTSS